MDEVRRTELEARAKANLRLRVLGRRADGFHDLESLFVRLELADRLELEVGGEPGIRLEVEGGSEAVGKGASVPEGPENLVWRAVDRFFGATGGEPAVSVRLHKRIPAGAGLGGGSADAAAALRGLNELADAPLSEPELLGLAGELGSDVPFLTSDLPAALGWGRGARLLPVPPPPARPLLIAVPETRIGTAQAYGWLDRDRDGGADLPGPASLPPAESWSDWETVAELAVNDFERPVFSRFPELGWWKEELEGEGAELALLCGSGSALLGVFTDADLRDAAARRLEAADTVGVLRTRGPV